MRWNRRTTTGGEESPAIIRFLCALFLMAGSQFAVAANIVATPSSLDFGSLVVGEQSEFRQINLYNNDYYSASSISIVSSSGFIVRHNCPLTLAGEYDGPGPRSCTVNVAFAPTLARTHGGWIRVGYSDFGVPLYTQIDLDGVGLPAPSGELTVTPDPLDFGSVAVGQSATQEVTVSNTGTGGVVLDPLAVTGDFSQTNDCDALPVLIAGASCTATVTFTPTAVGEAPGELQVSGVDVDTESALSAAAVLVGAATPAYASLVVTPDLLNFGNVGINQSSAAQSVTVTNSGNGKMDLDPVSVSGAFSQTTDCGSVLGSGESCVVSVTFNPVTVGDASGVLSITGLDPGNNEPLAASVPLQGVGLDILGLQLTPASISFSGTLPDAESSVQPVTITNPYNVKLLIDQLAVSGPFTQGNDCGGYIPPLGSCVAQIAFAPEEGGSSEGELLIIATVENTAVTVSGSAALSGSTMTKQQAEALLMPYAGDNPSVISVTGVIADTCTSGRASDRLQADCNALFAAAESGDQGLFKALAEITPERAIKSSRLMQQGGQTQVGNLASRIAALRAGATGIAVGGLSLKMNDQTLTGDQVVSLLKAGETGGSAGADEGLLGSGWGGFVTGSIATGDKEANALESGLDFRTLGITAGLDYRLSEAFVLGGAFGYMSTDTDLDANGGTVDSTGYSLSAYGTYYPKESYYVDFSATYGWNDFDQDRMIGYELQNQGVIDQKASTDYDGDMIALSVGSGYDFNRGSWTLSPRLALDYVRAEVDGFSESMSNPDDVGGGWATRIDDTDQKWLTLKLGGKVTYAHSASWGVLTPYAGVDWLHEFEDDAQIITGGFVEDPGSMRFSVYTDDPDRDYVRMNLGVAAVFQNGIMGYLDYDTILANSHWDRQTFSLGLRVEF